MKPSSKIIRALIEMCLSLFLAILLSSCGANTQKSMYPIGTKWNVGGSSFTVIDVVIRSSYQDELGSIMEPDTDCKFIIVECSASLTEGSKLQACSVKESDVYADSHPLFTAPIFLRETSIQNGKNCILLFSIPINDSSDNLSSYAMNVSMDVNGKTYSEDFSFSTN